MSEQPRHETTSVDDVREVREELDRMFKGDYRRHAEHSNAVARKLSRKLGLRLVRGTTGATDFAATSQLQAK